MDQELTREVAYIALNKFFRNKPFVLFGTGTSCAVDASFGMDGLRKHLLEKMPIHNFTNIQHEEWNKVVSYLNEGKDLESSMNNLRDASLIRQIIDCTAEFVGLLDREYSVKIFTGSKQWTAAPLFKRLVDGLPELDPILHIATPNYDLLAEYAFENMGIPYITGFYGGVFRRWDWKEAERSVTCVENEITRGKSHLVKKYKKHIRLYKVHGSLNTFIYKGDPVENNIWLYEPGTRGNYERLMITPGTSKYESLHKNRSELLSRYDQSIEKHQAFLFLGFGFNDNQLTTNAILRKLKEHSCPGLIITRDINDRITEYIKDCKDLWLVCKNPDNLGTRIYNSRFQNCLEISDIQLWNFAVFTDEILGG